MSLTVIVALRRYHRHEAKGISESTRNSFCILAYDKKDLILLTKKALEKPLIASISLKVKILHFLLVISVCS